MYLVTHWCEDCRRLFGAEVFDDEKNKDIPLCPECEEKEDAQRRSERPA
jgi:NAD-dependent SIR2 family protein deacetylase